jgi:hypothetical protein
MSTTVTAEEWLRDYTKNERYRNTLKGVHAVRSLFDVLPDHPCPENCWGHSFKAMHVRWEIEDNTLSLLRPEYPSTPLTSPASADTGEPA